VRGPPGASASFDSGRHLGGTVSKRSFYAIACSAAVGLILVIFFLTRPAALKSPSGDTANKSWNREAIGATYVATQLREMDKTHSTLTLSYDLENNTDSDFRLDAGPGIVVLSRLEADGSLSQQEPVRLSYPVFLPARQHARLAIEITQPFAWPSEDNPAYIDKLREFVKQRLANVQEFVLFDQSSRTEVKLPGVWQQLQETAQASY